MNKIVSFRPRSRGSDEYEPPSVDSCPVQPLGRSKLKFYFFASSGEVVELNHREIQAEAAVTALFDGCLDWLAESPYFRGNRTDSIDYKAVGRWLMQGCAACGIWDPSTPLRGPGVWRGADGKIIVHAGDAVLVDGQWQPSGRAIGGVLYPAGPCLQRPSEEPAEIEVGCRLLEAARLWRYGDPEIAPDLVIGMIGSAMLGAAPAHRAHAMITGPFGNGKSELMNFIAAALGAGAHPQGNDATTASIHQIFTGQARALLLDEAEQEGGPEKLAGVIMLLRRMSTGQGAQIMRGSAAGQGMHFSVTGCAILAATLMPALKPQDRSRFTEIRMEKLQVDPKNVLPRMGFESEIAYAAKMSPQLRARAIQGWERFKETFRVYHIAFMEKGMQPRDANQAATILAGRDLLISDEVPQSDGLRYEVERFQAMINWAAENQSEGEGIQAFERLMTFPVEGQRAGERLTVSELVWKAFHDQTEPKVWARKLPSLGIRAEGGVEGKPRAIWVARRNEFLRKVYQGSNWDNRWSEALRQLEGAKNGDTCQRFAGTNLRYTIIPERWLPMADDPAFFRD